MTAARVSFNDILGAISQENSTISSGNIVLGGQRRNIRLTGEIENLMNLKILLLKLMVVQFIWVIWQNQF